MTTETKTLDERVDLALGHKPAFCTSSNIEWSDADGGLTCQDCGEPLDELDETPHERYIPRYSTDIAAAWELVEAMRKRGWTGLLLDQDVDTRRWTCSLRRREKLKEGGGIEWYARTAETAPEVICAVALVALNSTATHDLDPEE